MIEKPEINCKELQSDAVLFIIIRPLWILISTTLSTVIVLPWILLVIISIPIWELSDISDILNYPIVLIIYVGFILYIRAEMFNFTWEELYSISFDIHLKTYDETISRRRNIRIMTELQRTDLIFLVVVFSLVLSVPMIIVNELQLQLSLSITVLFAYYMFALFAWHIFLMWITYLHKGGKIFLRVFITLRNFAFPLFVMNLLFLLSVFLVWFIIYGLAVIIFNPGISVTTILFITAGVLTLIILTVEDVFWALFLNKISMFTNQILLNEYPNLTNEADEVYEDNAFAQPVKKYDDKKSEYSKISDSEDFENE